jgi:hypothetical protein
MVSAAGGSSETASELLAVLRGARVEYAAWKDAYRDSGIGGEQQADDVARYEKCLELLRDAASTGTEAAAVIRRSLESLR